MTNAVYPWALEQLGRGAINWPADTIKVQLVGAGYTYDSANRSPDDLTDTIGTATLATNTVVSAGAFYADPMNVPAPAGDTVTGIAVYQEQVASADSVLICFIDTRSDSAPISVATDGSDIVLSWASNIIFRI